MDMEEAYWYYIDIYRTVWPELLSVSFDGFTQQSKSLRTTLLLP